MTDLIDVDTFNHLVTLAALELSQEQADYLRRELNNQLKAIQELEAIPLENDLTITSHGVPYTAEISPRPRLDEWKPFENPASIIRQAPQVQDGYIVVPDIPHQTLE
jgi:aspartyl-tRNA(Asn)/glutamyl-tRNA(Gln) amidotransferase subunit C